MSSQIINNNIPIKDPKHEHAVHIKAKHDGDNSIISKLLWLFQINLFRHRFTKTSAHYTIYAFAKLPQSFARSAIFNYKIMHFPTLLTFARIAWLLFVVLV